ncbi:MAG: hypothetical protein E7403_07635 [Ruminococcaceae bacterium]|nr:hypothetical protein [Oscillospiraceae bacterium]
MSIRKKTMLMLFVDFLICLLIQLFGLFIFSWMFNYSWGKPVYSIVFCLTFFGVQYSRVHTAASRALKRKELKPVTEGLIMAAPLVIVNLVIILVYGLMQMNVIPIRDVVANVVYEFPDDAPRNANKIYLLSYIAMGVRLWFSHLSGFMNEKTPAALLLISPAITLLASYLGYLAGSKKYYLSDLIYKVQEKVKKKFNE